jgi:hypothetical protein
MVPSCGRCSSWANTAPAPSAKNANARAANSVILRNIYPLHSGRPGAAPFFVDTPHATSGSTSAHPQMGYPSDLSTHPTLRWPPRKSEHKMVHNLPRTDCARAQTPRSAFTSVPRPNLLPTFTNRQILTSSRDLSPNVLDRPWMSSVRRQRVQTHELVLLRRGRHNRGPGGLLPFPRPRAIRSTQHETERITTADQDRVSLTLRFAGDSLWRRESAG